MTVLCSVAKQQKIMMLKTGRAQDETYDDIEKDRETKMPFGRRKEHHYGADNVDFEIQLSDEDGPILEEVEEKRLHKNRAKSYSKEDFMPEDSDEEESDSGGEKILKDILPKTRARSKPKEDKEGEDYADTVYAVEKVLNALSREEQMEVVYRSDREKCYVDI